MLMFMGIKVKKYKDYMVSSKVKCKMVRKPRHTGCDIKLGVLE